MFDFGIKYSEYPDPNKPKLKIKNPKSE